MALYKPDPDLKDAIALINKMKEGHLPSSRREAELILYYIEKDGELINELRQKVHNYSEFFVQLDRFLPNHNPVLG